ncbi:YbaB/EbfC family nucleoid-associated protein [Chloroflexota bacterium]
MRSGKMFNKAMMRKAQQLQEQLGKAQEELAKAEVEASAGGGAVTVVVSGQQKLISVKISPEAVDPDDVGMLEDLILAAINEGMEKSKELAASQLGAATGMDIPGLM